MQLQGQVALVTGAGFGIGRAIACRLAEEGADIAIHGRTLDRLVATAEMVRERGRRAEVYQVDVSKDDEVNEAIAKTIADFGKIDILVNNAGIAKTQPFLDITKENWDNHIKVHLYGTFYYSQAVARHMRQRNYGRIISNASIAGLQGPIDVAHYGAAKAGIMGLFRAMALELGEYGITANVIAPGPIDTELLSKAWSKEMYVERASQIPVCRLGTMEEVAHAVLFLASLEAGYISGVVIPVDGGAAAAGAYMVEKYRRRKSTA